MDEKAKNKKIIFYVDEFGVSPVEEFLNSFCDSAKGKIAAVPEEDKLLAMKRKVNFEKLVNEGRIRLV